MNSGEMALKGLEMPLAAIRLLGGTIIWACEKAVGSNPELPRIGANIQVFESGSPQDPATLIALGHEADNLSAESAG